MGTSSPLTSTNVPLTVPARVLRVQRLPAAQQRVYNLEVATIHEYTANGFVVSNCDAARYGLMHAFEGSGRGGLGQRVSIGPGGLVVKAR